MRFAYMTVFFIQFIMTMELGSVYPIAPYLAELFGIEASKIILINIGFAVFGLVAPIFGMMADRIGSRKVITGSLGVLAFGMAVPLDLFDLPLRSGFFWRRYTRRHW